MKLSDYVAQFIVDEGVRHVFMIVGSANAYLADSRIPHSRVHDRGWQAQVLVRDERRRRRA